jgi:nuclear pore complex protein Nup98-Nup96
MRREGGDDDDDDGDDDGEDKDERGISISSGVTGRGDSRGGDMNAGRGREQELEQGEGEERDDAEAETEDCAPVLTKHGYFTYPDMRLLINMTPSELSRVDRFTVYRPGVGQIRWEGRTDLRYMNLDELVHIEHKMISVYDGMDYPEKPLEGLGLNKPAKVTLYDIYPKANSSSQKILAFSDKLQKKCAQNGSEFLEYDLQRGEWIFRTLNF